MPSLTLKVSWALVVPEVLADAGEIEHCGIPRAAVGPRGRCREHEQVGRFDRPGAQHHPVGCDGENFTPLSASTPMALPSLITIFRTNTPPRTVRFK